VTLISEHEFFCVLVHIDVSGFVLMICLLNEKISNACYVTQSREL